MAENNTIQQQVTIKAPPARVFQALTEAEVLEGWFPSKVESDPRPGGRYQYVFRYPDPDQGGTQEGKYLEIASDRKVSYTWDAGGKETRVDFTLTPSGDRTIVDLQHSGFGGGPEGDQAREMHSNIWGIYMDNLKSYLEQGKDKRSEAMGQVTN